MKIIYLLENLIWKSFEYENLENLKDEFEKRNISLGDRCTLGDCVSLITGIFLNDSGHSVTYTGNSTISIGCHNHTIDYWKENFIEIGENNNYLGEQISEYENYINIVELFEKGLKKLNRTAQSNRTKLTKGLKMNWRR